MRIPLNGSPRISNAHGNPGWGTFGKHTGIDYAVPVGTPIYAPGNGVVNAKFETSGKGSGGKQLQIRIGNYDHRFLHLNSFEVNNGQKVSEGQLIGYSGATGDVTGPHLHWDVRIAGTTWNSSYNNYINPLALLTEPPKGDTSMGVPDQDNYYWRYGIKLAEQTRGRTLSREEFKKFLVGQSDLRVVEILSDDPEADKALQAQRVGQLAVKDDWQGQIYRLQDQLKVTTEKLAQVTTQSELSTKLQKQVDELTRKNSELLKDKEESEKVGQSFIQWVGNLFKNWKN